ncbi:hypothetical protein F4561_005731 [Lipingzhangella halophila]|uniref:Uncharacterized protein n=1 Tax=Lipingzhangella halophila TaxID=1783352 RepID=A0A7W7RN68_9ACTN|nr:hypothetical protein [Lipingzhangella halophila]
MTAAPRTARSRPYRQPATVHPAARRVGHLFPGVTAWYGTHTGTWWAILPGHSRLLEAPTAEILEHRVASLLIGRGQSAPPPPRAVKPASGTAPHAPPGPPGHRSVYSPVRLLVPRTG